MKLKIRLTAFLVLVLGLVYAVPVNAQFNGGSSTWKKNRTEYYATIGATSFLGELGGRNEIGSDFVYDFELNQTRMALNLGIRYFMRKDLAVRGNLTIGYLAGNDNLTEEPFRMKRNLHFRSFVAEASGLLEYNYRRGNYGNKMALPGTRRTRARFKETVYSAFIGLGALKFNPQARYKEQWHDLRPLGTEGQNLGNDDNKYSLYALVIPVGINVRKSISQRINLSIELCHRFTFTDYIDDVSTEYYSNDEILFFSGETAAYLADPSFEFLELENGEIVYAANTEPGMQRGDSDDNDSYMSLSIGANYKLNTYKFKRRRRPVGSKRRGRRLVF